MQQTLADPLFHTPGKIEFLISAEIFMDIVQERYVDRSKAVPHYEIPA